MLYSFAADAVDGWQLATEHLRNLLWGKETNRDLGAEAALLGQAVAAVHDHLAGAMGQGRMTGADVAGLRAGMLARFESARAEVPALAGHESGARAVFAAAGAAGEIVHRVHGDLHLGQVLRTPNRWLLIDFEGEPATPLPERRSARSPLRDVAGMLRSFDYAATLELKACRHPDPDGSHRIATRWLARARGAFLRGYAKAAGIDAPAAADLLAAFELDKAVYEVCYETRNRPQLAEVPLRAVRRLTSAVPHEVRVRGADLLE
jgi:maltokinase